MQCSFLDLCKSKIRNAVTKDLTHFDPMDAFPRSKNKILAPLKSSGGSRWKNSSRIFLKIIDHLENYLVLWLFFKLFPPELKQFFFLNWLIQRKKILGKAKSPLLNKLKASFFQFVTKTAYILCWESFTVIVFFQNKTSIEYPCMENKPVISWRICPWLRQDSMQISHDSILTTWIVLSLSMEEGKGTNIHIKTFTSFVKPQFERSSLRYFSQCCFTVLYLL